MVLSSADIFFKISFFVVVVVVFSKNNLVISVECQAVGSKSCPLDLIWV